MANQLAKVEAGGVTRTEIFMSKIDQFRGVAAAMVKSGLLPDAIKSDTQAVAIMFKAFELGIPPVTALSHLAVVNGKPTLEANLMKALVVRDHPDAVFRIVTMTEKENKLECWDSRQPKTTFEFTMEDANRANLTGKDPWKKYPKLMLYYRNLSQACKVMWPDAVFGVAVTQEGMVDLGEAELVEVEGPVETSVEEGTQERGDEEQAPPTINTRSDDYRRVMAKCNNLGISDEDQKGWIFDHFGKKSRKDLTVLEFNQFASWVESHDVEEQPSLVE